MKNLPLNGKKALVTGGAIGIGKACVTQLAALGATVIFTTRSEKSLKNALESHNHPSVTGLVADISNSNDLKTIFKNDFDILVNNAAQVTPIGKILDIDMAEFSAAMNANVTAQIAAIQACLPYMLSRGQGTVVNISSGAGHRPQEGWAAYCASKAALAMITRSLDLEYGHQGIRSFGIAPGVVDTDMQVTIRASGINPISQIPREALSAPQAPGQAVAWLCTAAADPWVGKELDIRDPELRQAIGLE